MHYTHIKCDGKSYLAVHKTEEDFKENLSKIRGFTVEIINRDEAIKIFGIDEVEDKEITWTRKNTLYEDSEQGFDYLGIKYTDFGNNNYEASIMSSGNSPHEAKKKLINRIKEILKKLENKNEKS